MTDAQIDRLLAGDPSFGIVPLVVAKVAKDVASRKDPPPVVVAPSPAPLDPAPLDPALLVLVSILALGAGVGAGYMVGRR